MVKKEVKTELTREDQEAVIAGGGSVLIDGQIISKLEDLPETEESIAKAERALEARKVKATKAKK